MIRVPKPTPAAREVAFWIDLIGPDGMRPIPQRLGWREIIRHFIPVGLEATGTRDVSGVIKTMKRHRWVKSVPLPVRYHGEVGVGLILTPLGKEMLL